MNISALVIKSGNKRCRHIGKPACFCCEIVGHIAHPSRQVGDFRRYDKDARFFCITFHSNINYLFYAQVMSPGAFSIQLSPLGFTLTVKPCLPVLLHVNVQAYM